jgi:hypothetical protein
MQEWSYLDQAHTTETVSYMVAEEGSWKLPDGTWFEAGKAAGTSKWKTVKFVHKFTKTPVVFTQITTQQKARPYTTRQNYISNRKFRFYIQAEEKQRVTENEEVSWVAFDLTNRKNTKQQWFVGKTKNVVDEKGTLIRFNNENTKKDSQPSFFA